ncbi:uncharacterized protein V1518DRAFT_411894 [Limtongia smithiae]|uniref:uncharacterized protein n=1 Tax=Limtongia smithiae TaxID=1125753 RepID=UPI0034CF8F13
MASTAVDKNYGLVFFESGYGADLTADYQDDRRLGPSDRSESQTSDYSTNEKIQDLEVQLPHKRGSYFFRYLRHIVFTHYRKLFTIVATGNMCGIIVYLARYARNSQTEHLLGAVTATTANIVVGSLFRNDHVINMLFILCASVPRRTPLWLRTHFARVFHYGGLHSGSGFSGVMWYIVYIILLGPVIRHNPDNMAHMGAVIGLSYTVLVALLFIIISAYPTIRMKYHDWFERIHRFATWIAVMLLWCLVMVLVDSSSILHQRSFGKELIHWPPFWFLIILSCLLAYPWLYLRRRRVGAEILSSHATRLHFDYQRMSLCQGIKISANPLLGWHAFATLPEPGGEGFSCIVSGIGDWSEKDVEQGVELWTRGLPVHGVLRIATIFSRVILVATGSGIGPCLSLLMSHSIPCRILWSTRDPVSTYSQVILDEVYRADPSAVILSYQDVRPDMVLETYKLVQEFDAEAVFIVSNPSTTKKVVYEMQSRGICAYGPIFDL